MPSKVSLAFVIANVLGVAVYLYLCSRYTWAIPEERAHGVYAVSGEPFVWAGIVVPIWGAFLVINLIWAITIVVQKRWRNALLWSAVACTWLVAAVVDNAHH